MSFDEIDSQRAQISEVIADFVDSFHRPAELFADPLIRSDLAETECEDEVALLIADRTGQRVVLRSVGIDLVEHARRATDHLGDLNDLLTERLGSIRYRFAFP